MFLLDTNVISELRRARPHGAVLAWIESIGSAKLFLCAITIGEIQAGVEITRAAQPSKAVEIERWMETLIRDFEVIPIDTAIARRWAKLMNGRPDKIYEDAFVAATALEHNLIVVTRNTKDFARLTPQLFNPFEFKSPKPQS